MPVWGRDKPGLPGAVCPARIPWSVEQLEQLQQDAVISGPVLKEIWTLECTQPSYTQPSGLGQWVAEFKTLKY